MTATIRLAVNSGSGVLAAVANQLRTSGMRVKSHNIEATSSTTSVLTLHVETSGNVDLAELREKLSDLSVVQGVEELNVQEAAAANATKKVDAPEELVDRIVDAFPKIMSHIQNYEEQLAKDTRKNEKLRDLGIAVGAKFAATADVAGLESDTEIIDQVILPRIAYIAEASREKSSIVVTISLFTRRMVTSMDLFSGEDEQCYFLSGLIEGMLASFPGHDAATVKETKCRANGDAACVFVPG